MFLVITTSFAGDNEVGIFWHFLRYISLGQRDSKSESVGYEHIAEAIFFFFLLLLFSQHPFFAFARRTEKFVFFSLRGIKGSKHKAGKRNVEEGGGR